MLLYNFLLKKNSRNIIYLSYFVHYFFKIFLEEEQFLRVISCHLCFIVFMNTTLLFYTNYNKHLNQWKQKTNKKQKAKAWFISNSLLNSLHHRDQSMMHVCQIQVINLITTAWSLCRLMPICINPPCTTKS